MHGEDRRSSWQHLQDPIGSHCVIFTKDDSPEFHTKCQIWGTPSALEMPYCVERRDIHCCWVFQKLPLMHDKDGKISWQHLRAPCGSYRAFLAKVYSQISHKIPGLEHPPSTGNGMIYCNERYRLLLKYSITFLWCMMKMVSTFEFIYEPLIAHTMSILPM